LYWNCLLLNRLKHLAMRIKTRKYRIQQQFIDCKKLLGLGRRTCWQETYPAHSVDRRSDPEHWRNTSAITNYFVAEFPCWARCFVWPLATTTLPRQLSFCGDFSKKESIRVTYKLEGTETQFWTDCTNSDPETVCKAARHTKMGGCLLSRIWRTFLSSVVKMSISSSEQIRSTKDNFFVLLYWCHRSLQILL
jgi:hypothetical protein